MWEAGWFLLSVSYSYATRHKAYTLSSLFLPLHSSSLILPSMVEFNSHSLLPVELLQWFHLCYSSIFTTAPERIISLFTLFFKVLEFTLPLLKTPGGCLFCLAVSVKLNYNKIIKKRKYKSIKEKRMSSYISCSLMKQLIDLSWKHYSLVQSQTFTSCADTQKSLEKCCCSSVNYCSQVSTHRQLAAWRGGEQKMSGMKEQVNGIIPRNCSDVFKMSSLC